jgi:hypothetical protein
MDAYDVAEKIKKYWCALYSHNSGEIIKPTQPVKVRVKVDGEYRTVTHVSITQDFIELEIE